MTVGPFACLIKIGALQRIVQFLDGGFAVKVCFVLTHYHTAAVVGAFQYELFGKLVEVDLVGFFIGKEGGDDVSFANALACIVFGGYFVGYDSVVRAAVVEFKPLYFFVESARRVQMQLLSCSHKIVEAQV